jgi:DNA-directed RNA polymerase subunit RPC12/RpoP
MKKKYECEICKRKFNPRSLIMIRGVSACRECHAGKIRK